MAQNCRAHVKRRAIAEWTDPGRYWPSGQTLGPVGWQFFPASWIDGESDQPWQPWELPAIDPLDFLPESYEEAAAWRLGLNTEDMPGWGTEVDLTGMTIITH